MPDHRPGPDWARIHGTEILNPDGWRAAGIPFGQPITLDDYTRLAATSTQRPARTPTEPASPHRETGRAIRDAGGIPPGPWRVGSQCGRNLWIGPPRPDGVDVGRMDTDVLAAHVVQAVNERDRLRAALEAIHAIASDTDDSPDRLPRSPHKQLRVIARAAAEALDLEEAQ